MHTFVVTAHYATWHGNMASCRRHIEAADHSEALRLMAKRVEGFKRYMGKLDMDCVRFQPNLDA